MNSSGSDQSQAINEVSLLDLAVTFVRHKRVFAIVFALVFGFSLIWAFIAKESYQYTTLVQLVEAEGQPLAKPKTVIAGLLSRTLPEIELAYAKANSRKVPFKMQFDIPDGTSLIRIVSEAGLDDAHWVKDLQQQVLADLMSRQAAIEQSYRDRIAGQIESANEHIQRFQGASEPGQALSTLLNRVSDLEDKLTKLVGAEALAVSSRSAEKISHGKAFIILFGGILAGLLGIISTFTWAAMRLVQSRL